MSPDLANPTAHYHSEREKLRAEQEAATKAFREKQDAERAEFDEVWNVRWRELQQLVGFRT